MSVRMPSNPAFCRGEMAAEDILADEVEKPTPEVPLASPEDGREEESRIRESEQKAESEGRVLEKQGDKF